MHKNLHISVLCTALLLLGACSRQETPVPRPDEGEYTEVLLEAGGLTRGATRAEEDPVPPELPAGVDAGSYHWRYVFEIHDVSAGGVLQNIGVSPRISMRLLKGHRYTIYTWVDIVADGAGGDKTTTANLHYDVSIPGQLLAMAELVDIRTNPSTAYTNAPTREAYAGIGEADLSANPDLSSVTITATRPHAQICVYATDKDDFTALCALSEREKPYEARCNYTQFYFNYNAHNPASPFVYFAYNIPFTSLVEYQAGTAVLANDGLVVSDLVFAADGETTLGELTVDLYTKPYEVSPGVMQGAVQLSTKKLTNIPIRRNYRTNVYTRLLTESGELTITVEPLFTTPGIENEVI